VCRQTGKSGSVHEKGGGGMCHVVQVIVIRRAGGQPAALLRPHNSMSSSS
jgi:hypothetical protein